jgi:site-specific DNA-methyltransferase (adenine-specific)/modification methylase
VKEFSTKYSNFSDNMPMDEYYIFHKKVLSEMLRVSKIIFYNIQVVTGNKPAVFKLIGYFSEHIKDIVIWDKGYGQPAMHTGVLNAQHELILILGDNPIARAFTNPYFNRGGLSNVWQIPRERSIYKKHGATFPKKLVEIILENFSKEGDIIYDPFMGSGTTAVVAKRMGRNYIGSETSQEYCTIAEERLTNE